MTGDPADRELAEVAARHGFSPGAVSALRDAIRRGGGRMAQFSHPELGGMGQWSAGGLLQIGVLFDDALKARVAAVCVDLAEALGRAAAPGRSAAAGPAARSGGADPHGPEGLEWWGTDLGRPSASGAQNGTRYAYFEHARRLAVERDGHVTVYDTGRHRIFGVSQSQSLRRHLAFTADDGTVDLATLDVVQGSRLTKD